MFLYNNSCVRARFSSTTHTHIPNVIVTLPQTYHMMQEHYGNLKCSLISITLRRGLGVMDLCEQPIFAAAFETALQRHSLRSLEPRLMRQLLQVSPHLPGLALSVLDSRIHVIVYAFDEAYSCVYTDRQGHLAARPDCKSLHCPMAAGLYPRPGISLNAASQVSLQRAGCCAGGRCRSGGELA